MKTLCLPPTSKYESMHRDVTIFHSIYSIFYENGAVGTFSVHQAWNLSRNRKMCIMNQRC